jgi:hypothetical protein
MPHQSVPAFLLLACLLAFAYPGESHAQGAVAGRVADPDGRPVPAVQVFLVSGQAVVASARTGRDGSFVVEPPAPGPYSLGVTAEGLRAAPLTLRVHEEAQDVGTIRLRVSAITDSVVVSAAHVDVPLSVTSSAITVITGEEIRARQYETVADALRGARFRRGVEQRRARRAHGGAPRGGESDFTLVSWTACRSTRSAAASTSRPAGERTSNGSKWSAARRARCSAPMRSGRRRPGRHAPRRRAPAPRARIEGGSRHAAAGGRASGGRAPGSWGSRGTPTSDGFTGIAPATGERVATTTCAWRPALSGARRRASRFGRPSHHRAAVVPRARLPRSLRQRTRSAPTPASRLSRRHHEATGYGARRAQPLGGVADAAASTSAATDGTIRTNDFDETRTASRPWARGGATVRVQLDGTSISRSTPSIGTALAARARQQHVHHRRRHRRAGPRAMALASSPSCGWSRLARFAHGRRAPRADRRDALPPSPTRFTPRPTFGPKDTAPLNPKVAAAWYLSITRSGSCHAPARGGGYRDASARRPRDRLHRQPHLQPERSRSVEAGSTRRGCRRPGARGPTGFVNRYDDLIVAVARCSGDASRYRTDNISNARSRGLETSLALRTAAGARRAVRPPTRGSPPPSSPWTAPRAPPPFSVGRPAARRPTHQGSLDALRPGGDHRLRTARRARPGARRRSVVGQFGGLHDSPGFSVLDAGASLRVLPPAAVVFARDNVLDRALRGGPRLPGARARRHDRGCALLRADNVTFEYPARRGRSARRLRGVSLELVRRRVARHPRPERLGQDDAAPAARGPAAADRGPGHASRPRSRRSPAALARRIAVVPQETRLAFDFTVLEIVLMGRFPHLGAFEMEGRRGPGDRARRRWPTPGRAPGRTGCSRR